MIIKAILTCLFNLLRTYLWYSSVWWIQGMNLVSHLDLKTAERIYSSCGMSYFIPDFKSAWLHHMSDLNPLKFSNFGIENFDFLSLVEPMLALKFWEPYTDHFL